PLKRLRSGDAEVDVGSDGEPVDTGSLHGVYPGRLESILRNVQHEWYAESPARLDCGGNARSASRTDQEYNVSTGFGSEDDLVASPVSGHHLGDHRHVWDCLLDALDRRDSTALDEWVADLDELRTGLGGC